MPAITAQITAATPAGDEEAALEVAGRRGAEPWVPRTRSPASDWAGHADLQDDEERHEPESARKATRPVTMFIRPAPVPRACR